MGSYIKLQDITTGQQNCKVAGRLIRLWDAKNLGSKSSDSFLSIDGVLLDEHGTMAQITIPKRFEKQFRPLLSQGDVYIFSDVTAANMRNKTHIYHHQPYMLQFKFSPKVHKLQSRGSAIPNFSFNFCPFDELPNKNVQQKPLIDLLGVICFVGPYDFASPISQKKNRKILIRDLEEQSQEIVLWGGYGESFDEELVLQKAEHGIVIAIFAGLTVGTYTGKLEAASTSATEIFIDLDIPEVAKYRTSYQWETPTLQKQLPIIEQLSPIQAAGKLYDLSHISQLPISSFQGGTTYCCIAKITDVLPSTEWYYKACHMCSVGYNNNSETPRCTCTNSFPKPMYKLPLTIADDSASIDTIAFSSVAQDLVEYTAMQASQNMKIPADEHVPALDNAIGKKRLFHIGRNGVYSTKFSSNCVLKKSFPTDDHTPKILPAPPNDIQQKQNTINTTEDINSMHDNVTIDSSPVLKSHDPTKDTSTSYATTSTTTEPANKKIKHAHPSEDGNTSIEQNTHTSNN